MPYRYLVNSLDGRPRGLAMYRREGSDLDMLAWDWLEGVWRSAPDIVGSMLFGDDNEGVYEVTRAEAEHVAAQLGIQPVPDEHSGPVLD